jgi:hypothetical protein
MNKEHIEKVARAINLEIKEQWAGQQVAVAKELNDPTSWSAEAGTLDLNEVAKSAITAYHKLLIEEDNME